MVSSTRIAPTGAADCSREAVLTTSPDAIPSPASGRVSSAISASPVVMPMRTSTSPSSASASRIASAARTARSGSSSCTTGAPNTAITASPMNFSTVPPRRSSSTRRRACSGWRKRRTSSGSIRSARAVNPTTSANSTDTTLRSSRPAGTSATNAAPHELQNRDPAGFS